jgi:hypothetical protein
VWGLLARHLGLFEQDNQQQAGMAELAAILEGRKRLMIARERGMPEDDRRERLTLDHKE